MIYTSHHKLSFRFSGSDRIFFNSVIKTSKKNGSVYSMNRIWLNFNWAEFQWINGNFLFGVPSYSVHTVLSWESVHCNSRPFILDKFSFQIFLCFLICKLISVILYVKSWIHTQVRDFLINKYLKLIEVLFHAKYTICEVYQENWLTWAAPGQNSEKDTP